ncbi:hypothetical protein P7L68_04545 (plasmid) [Tistrella mobilis]|uniref:hypothetical protein n=1 Tax=Tistrella mobilis TaxID=171437 RepID=UPI003556F1CC
MNEPTPAQERARHQGQGITPGPHPGADAHGTPGPDAPVNPSGHPPVEDRTDARQARTTGRMRHVLWISLSLAVLAMVIVYLLMF